MIIFFYYGSYFKANEVSQVILAVVNLCINLLAYLVPIDN